MPTEEDLDYLAYLKKRFWSEFKELCDRYQRDVEARDPAFIEQFKLVLVEDLLARRPER